MKESDPRKHFFPLPVYPIVDGQCPTGKQTGDQRSCCGMLPFVKMEANSYILLKRTEQPTAISSRSPSSQGL